MFMNVCERFPYPYEYVYFTCSYLGRIFLDVNILHILFGAGGQGMSFTAWLRVWVHTIKETAKNIGINFERLVQVMEGDRGNAKETIEKRKESSTSKTKQKMRHPKSEKKKNENCRHKAPRMKERKGKRTQFPKQATKKTEKEKELNSINRRQMKKKILEPAKSI